MTHLCGRAGLILLSFQTIVQNASSGCENIQICIKSRAAENWILDHGLDRDRSDILILRAPISTRLLIPEDCDSCSSVDSIHPTSKDQNEAL